jgi:hypothetical protein
VNARPKPMAECIDVDAYQWRKMLMSPHGPRSQNARLVALAIHMHMSGDNPEAWPSQELIAECSQVSVRQTRRLIEQLQSTGWLKVQLMRRAEGGHNWKLSVYSPTVPAHLAEHVPPRPWEEDPTYRRTDTKRPTFTPEGPDTQMSAASPEGPDTQMSSPSTSGTPERSVTRHEGADISDEGADILDPSTGHLTPKVRTFSTKDRTSGCPTNSYLNSEGTKKESKKERAAGAAPVGESEILRIIPRPRPEGGATAMTPCEARPILRPDPPTDSPEDRIAKLRKLIASLPDWPDEQIRQSYPSATLEEVRQARGPP